MDRDCSIAHGIQMMFPLETHKTCLDFLTTVLSLYTWQRWKLVLIPCCTQLRKKNYKMNVLKDIVQYHLRVRFYTNYIKVSLFQKTMTVIQGQLVSMKLENSKHSSKLKIFEHLYTRSSISSIRIISLK